MTAKIICTWGADAEGKVKFSPGFENLTRIAKLDFMRDVIHDITQAYNAELDNFNKEGPGQ